MSAPLLGEPASAVVVTGAASGIGRASAEALAAVGRPVVLWDLDAGGVEEAAGSLAAHGVAVHHAVVDVTKTTALAVEVAEARAAVGPLGGLVHAAGIAGSTSFEELDEDRWDSVLDVHLRAAVFLMKVLTEDLKANPGSAVVLLGSIGSFIAWPTMAPYVSAKSGLLGLARSLCQSLAPEVRVNVVCPGYVDTPMLPVSQRMADAAPLARIARPEDVARAVRFLLSEEASFITGTQLVVDGGVLARTP